MVEHRLPTFFGAQYAVFGSKKFLCGNMASIDLVRLNDHEGESYDQDLKLLFAGRSLFSLGFQRFCASNNSFWGSSQRRQDGGLPA